MQSEPHSPIRRKRTSSIFVDYLILCIVALCLLSSLHSSFSVTKLIEVNSKQIKKNHKMIIQLKELLRIERGVHNGTPNSQNN